MNYIFSNRINTLQPSAIREILKATSDPKIIPFAAGNPAPDAFPVETIRRIADELLRENPIGALQYSVTEGFPPFRQQLKDLLHRRYRIGGDQNDVLVVSGAQQGIDLAARALVNEGDTVLCEDPTFVAAINCFRSYQAQVVGVEMEADGISVEKLEEAMKKNPNAKLLYLIPNFQNPSGITMSHAKRKAVYELACRHGVLILEDNPYGDLRYEGEDIPSIKSMDTENIVIYLGSFSKILSPGLRVGYVCAPAPILQKMTVAKQCNDVHTPILNQLICHRFLEQVDFQSHVEKLRKIYRGKLRLMLDGMDAHWNPVVSHTMPEGGLFLWATLPQGIDMMAFCKKALEHTVAVVPGNAFSTCEGAPVQSFRLNFSTPTDEKIVEGIEILGRLTQKL